MATTPQFAATPVLKIAQVSTANTNRDGTGTIVDIVTGASAGTRIDRITIEAVATTTAGMVRLYINDGTNTRLWKEVVVAPITPGASAQTFYYVLSGLGLMLPSGYKLQASTNNAETFNVIAEGGSL